MAPHMYKLIHTYVCICLLIYICNVSWRHIARMSTSNLMNVLQFFVQHLTVMKIFRPSERTSEELQLVYEELLHVKALTHLSTMVKRELASVVFFEQHQHAGHVLFRQGDPGNCWYIVLKGCVDVIIHGKVSLSQIT